MGLSVIKIGPDGKPVPMPINQDDLTNAELGMASGGMLGLKKGAKGQDLIRPTAHSAGELAGQLASLPLFLYGGPEAREGAGMLERGLATAGRAGVTGAENVASDIIQKLTSGRKGEITPSAEAGAFGTGAAGGGVFEGLRNLIPRTAGLPQARAARTEATAALAQPLAERQAGQRLRSVLGGTAPQASSDVLNQETRAAQNALGHTINSIHHDINADYRTLFAPYKNNEVPVTFADPLVELQTQLKAEGRYAQLGRPARTLLESTIEMGQPDPLVAQFGAEEVASMSHKEREGYRAYFGKAKAPVENAGEVQSTIKGRGQPKVAPKPVGPTVQRVLQKQSEATGILMNPSAKATDKAVARDVLNRTQGSLDELGDKQFLTPAERQQHQALKGRTRSFYTDYRMLQHPGRTQTPGAIGAMLLNQPQHVISRLIDSAKDIREIESLRRSVADAIIPPEGGTLEAAIPRLQEMDQAGTLRKLYPGRYGRLADWTSTITAQRRLDAATKDPQLQNQAVQGLQSAANSPEGRAFLTRMEKLKLKTPQQAAVESVRPGSGQQQVLPSFMVRWIGLYQPIEALIGMGMMKTNPAVAAGAFATFIAHTGFRRALQNEAFRTRYLSAIENPNVQQSVYSLARLAMGIALTESNKPDTGDNEP